MSEVIYVERTVKCAKNTTEVTDAVASIIRDFREGKSLGEIATGNLGKLKDAVAGWDQLDDEARAEHYGNTLAFGVGSIMDALRSE